MAINNVPETIFYGTNNPEKAIQIGMHDAVLSGVNPKILRGVPSKFAYVNSKAQRVLFENDPPGTIVATYGLDNIWQLTPGGNWVAIIEAESE